MSRSDATSGVKVTWIPCEIVTWGHNDEWMNEFTFVTDEELNEEQMEAYVTWSESEVTGQVVRTPPAVMQEPGDEYVYIQCDVYPKGLTSRVVAYRVEDFNSDVFKKEGMND